MSYCAMETPRSFQHAGYAAQPSTYFGARPEYSYYSAPQYMDAHSSESAASSPGLHHVTPSPPPPAPPSSASAMHPSILTAPASSSSLSAYSSSSYSPSAAVAPQPTVKQYSFVTLPGNQVRKRPRRRYDEIERLYACRWSGCNKSYGTLNHLNAHVTMQKHGDKRSPNEFKEMRKHWRKQKKDEQDRASAQATYASLVAAGVAPDVNASAAASRSRSHSNSVSSQSGPGVSRISTIPEHDDGSDYTTEYSPVDSDAGSVSVHAIAATATTPPSPIMARRMSMPNIGLGLDVSPHAAAYRAHQQNHFSPRSVAEYMASPPPSLRHATYQPTPTMQLPTLDLSAANSAAAADYQWMAHQQQSSSPHEAYSRAEYRYPPQSAPAHQLHFQGLPEPIQPPNHHHHHHHQHHAVHNEYANMVHAGHHSASLESLPQSMSDPVALHAAAYSTHGYHPSLAAPLTATHRDE